MWFCNYCISFLLVLYSTINRSFYCTIEHISKIQISFLQLYLCCLFLHGIRAIVFFVPYFLSLRFPFVRFSFFVWAFILLFLSISTTHQMLVAVVFICDENFRGLITQNQKLCEETKSAMHLHRQHTPNLQSCTTLDPFLQVYIAYYVPCVSHWITAWWCTIAVMRTWHRIVPRGCTYTSATQDYCPLVYLPTHIN